MATTVLECQDYAVVFLDSEGIDLDLPNNNQAMVFLTLLSLLSLFLIYNTKVFQKLHPNDIAMINSLSRVCASFLSQCKQSMKADAVKSFFPKFLLLFQDVNLRPKNKFGEEVKPTESLYTQILTSDSGDMSDLGKSAYFLPWRVKCFLCPALTSNIFTIVIVEQQETLKPTFNTTVEALTEKILQVTQKRAVDGAALLNGRMFAVLASSYVEAMKKPGSRASAYILHTDQPELYFSIIRDTHTCYSKRHSYLYTSTLNNTHQNVQSTNVPQGSLHQCPITSNMYI